MFRHKMRSHLYRRLALGGRCYYSQAAKNVTAFEIVIIDENVISRLLIIEIRLQEIEGAVQHSQLINEIFSKFFLAALLILIGYTEIVENGVLITAAAKGRQIDLKGFALIFIKIGILG